MGSRAENTVLVLELRNRGFTAKQISERVGLSKSYVGTIISDPTGQKAKQKRNTYRGSCESCGTQTDGSNGRASAPKLCVRCSRIKQHESRRWTPESILEAFRRYYHEYGHQPSANEALHMRVGEWFPGVGVVQREFGSWSNAIRAAGWEPWTKRGKRKRGTEVSEYVVLSNGDNAWHELARVDGTSGEHALKVFLSGLPEDKRHGRFVTIPTNSWKPRKVRLVMRPTLEVSPE